MLNLHIYSSFKKDLKLLIKQKFDKTLLIEVLDFLLYKKPLPHKFKNHPLKGYQLLHKFYKNI